MCVENLFLNNFWFIVNFLNLFYINSYLAFTVYNIFLPAKGTTLR